MKKNKKMIKGLVSIIIPVYNGEKYVKQAIDSALNQTYKNIEVIVIDDGSTDNSFNIIKKYNNKIIKIRQNNQGLPNARNNGIKIAKGEFISFLDCDDLFLPEKIEKQIELIKKDKKIGLVHTSYIIREIKTNKEIIYRGNNKISLLQDNYIGVSTVLCSSICLEKVGLFDPNTGGDCDWDLWLRISEKFNIKHLDIPLLIYNIHDSNASRNRKNRARYGLEKKLMILKKTYIRRNKPFKIKLMIYRTNFELIFAKIPFLNNPKVIVLIRPIYWLINRIEKKILK